MSTSDKVLKIAKYIFWFSAVVFVMCILANFDFLESLIIQSSQDISQEMKFQKSMNDIMLAFIDLLRVIDIYDICLFIASGLTTLGAMVWRHFHP